MPFRTPDVGDTTLIYHSMQAGVAGLDRLGRWHGTEVFYTMAAGTRAIVKYTYKQYATVTGAAVVTVTYLSDIDTAEVCRDGGATGTVRDIGVVAGAEALALDTAAGLAPTLETLTWGRGLNMEPSTGLRMLRSEGIQAGPVVSSDATSTSKTTLVWSTMDSHKVVPQVNNATTASETPKMRTEKTRT